MRFLVDRCAGHKLAEWLRSQGHDTVEARELGADPGDLTLLQWAVAEKRVLITIDTDFGQLIFQQGAQHCGLIRLPDVLANLRIQMVMNVLQKHSEELAEGAVVTVRGNKIRISKFPANQQEKE